MKSKNDILRYWNNKACRNIKPPQKIKTLQDAIRICKVIQNRKIEYILLVTIDKKYRVINRHFMNVGNEEECGLKMGKVVRLFFRDEAVGFFLAHNHPNGARNFSKADLILYAQLKYISELLGFGFFDNLVLPKGAEVISMSFRHPKAFQRIFEPLVVKSLSRFIPKGLGYYKSDIGCKDIPKCIKEN